MSVRSVPLGLAVPVRVIVEDPAATPVVVTVIVEAPGGVTGLTEKPTVELAGFPLAARVTCSLKLPSWPTATL